MNTESLACEARLQLGALDLDVAFTVDPGELVALVGPNGAGKSTLLRAIAGLQPIDAGRITLGTDVLDDPAAGVLIPSNERAIGVVFQDRLLFDRMTAIENVAFGLRSRGVRRADARTAAMQWMERFGVGALAELRPPQLSGGQAQRVALARALAFEPRALLLDEPFAALDATTRVEVKRDVRAHLSTLSIPRVIVTHDPIEAITLADRLVVLEAGRVTQHGTPADIRARPRSHYVADFVGVNLLEGTMRNGALTVANGAEIAVVDDEVAPGPATATIHPNAITLSHIAPESSARNVWQATITDVDHEGDRVRVHAAGPVSLVVEITPGAFRDLALAVGAEVWLAFKATAVHLEAG